MAQRVILRRLAGIPEANQGLLAQLAQQRGLTGHIVTLDAPAYLAVMMYADNRQLRETVYTAYCTRASELSNDGKFDNSALMEEILALRYDADFYAIERGIWAIA